MRYSELLQTARRLREQGFTVIGSRFKLPNLHKWKDPVAAQLFEWTVYDIQTGRANSLTVRMDGELAALDLDFYQDDATPLFVDLWRDTIGTNPVTVRGKKGGKVFFNLQDKPGPQTTEILLKEAPDVAETVELKQKLNAIELKKDVSAVCGQHSEGVEYSHIAGTIPFCSCTPEDLPQCSKEEIEGLCRDFARLMGWQEDRSSLPTDEEKEAARMCLSTCIEELGYINPDKYRLLCEFLKQTGHQYECEKLRRHGQGIEEGLPEFAADLWQARDKHITDADKFPGRLTAIRRLNVIYSKERAQLLTKLRACGFYDYLLARYDIDLAQVDFLSFLFWHKGATDAGWIRAPQCTAKAKKES